MSKKSGLSSFWRQNSQLSKLKGSLFLFFKTSFKLCSRQLLSPQVRLSDLARLYQDLLTPWAPYRVVYGIVGADSGDDEGVFEVEIWKEITD